MSRVIGRLASPVWLIGLLMTKRSQESERHWMGSGLDEVRSYYNALLLIYFNQIPLADPGND